MFSGFTKFIPTNINITTPDFLKPANHNGNHSPEASTNSADVKHRNLLTKPKAAPEQPAPDSQISTMDTVSVNDSENAHQIDNPSSKIKNESKQKKRRDAPTATETFYIVRPPPSKTNHPLNLQVQLLATSGRERVIRRSASSSSTRDDANGLTRSTTGSRETLNDNTACGEPLERSTSARSNRSDTESIYSAASSVSTNASTSSGRRMIPLYNLSAHNVMTNSITDAGTDAKIAKFFKRGLEIMGLAVLEPVEVYGKYTWDDIWDPLDPMRNNAAGGGASLSTQVSRTISHLSAISTQRAASSPSGSAILPGHPTNTNSNLTPVIESPSPTTPKAPTPPTEKDIGKKLFGGIFNKKKKEAPAPLPLLAPTASRDTNETAENVSTPRTSKRHSAAPSLSISSPLPSSGVGPSDPSFGATGSTISTAGDVLLQPQILGLQAVLQSPNIPPKGRPSTYVWVIRRWIRGNDDGFLGLGSMVESLGIMGAAEKNGSTVGMEVEVRFEWRRCAKSKSSAGAPSKDKERHSRRHSIAVEGQSTAAAPVNSPGSQNLTVDASASSPGSKRLSFQGFGLGKKSAPLGLPNDQTNASNDHLKVSRAPSPNPPASITTVGTNEESGPPKSPRISGAPVEESDSDSDIEDSERPWNCYLHIRGPPPSRTSSRDELATPHEPRNRGSPSRSKTLDIRLRVAALAPAPHHPKVIAQIKTPYPLPDVLFDASKTSAELRTRSDPDGSRPDLLAESVSSAGGRNKPIVLTSEDIKDVVSCTGLWLVVREGYGGLARKRKGDGWRLRG